uniref:SET domain-containing protein n=1 Tax=Petromyzon marinus TaxID=7757 RepID=S4RTD3_PETMA
MEGEEEDSAAAGRSEQELQDTCTYIVQDQPWPGPLPGAAPRAEATLPRNLRFHVSHTGQMQVVGVLSREFIPKGTRFGPLQGDVYLRDAVPQNANRQYFWRIYRHGELQHFVDGWDVSRSNWMRFVNPARSRRQNLVACQHGADVFFYTLRGVSPGRELLVWYSPEYTRRM